MCCTHPQRARIDFLICQRSDRSGDWGLGRRAIADRFGVTEGSVANHGRKHITPEFRRAALAGPFESEEALRELVAQEGTSVLQNLRTIFNGHRNRWLLALEVGDDRSMIAHAHAMSEFLWKIGKLTSEVLATPVVHQNNTVINVLEVPEYVNAMTRLSEALQPFPDARRAAAAALRGLAAPPGDRAHAVNQFAARLAAELTDGWLAKARPNQLAPPGPWSVWLIISGRGWGKTRVLAEQTNSWAASGRARRIAIVAATAADARDVLVEGESGILATAPDFARPSYEPSKRRLTWPNGAIATTYSAEEPDRLRGPQHDGAVADELASWSAPEAWDMLQFGLRLGQDPRTVIATTPRPVRLLRTLLAREGSGVVVTRGTSYENRANLAPGFFADIVAKYENTRLGRQELNAELLEDTPGSLWTLATLERSRRTAAPELSRVVVAVDPAVSSHEGSDETGIIIAGKTSEGRGYVLEDLSGRHQPAEWAKIAVDAYRRHYADRIVAEVNQGGDLVETTIRTIDPDVPFTAVHASRGKYTRAEPVAALFEQNRIHIVGSFPRLEDQMTGFVPDLDRGRAGSPDRVDAMVWAMTELMLEREPYQALFDWYAREAARGLEVG
jgi:predicted phage terminase large subunit-like protein